MKRGRPGPSSRGTAERTLVSVDTAGTATGADDRDTEDHHGEQGPAAAGDTAPAGPAGEAGRRLGTPRLQPPEERPTSRLWHVTLSVSGPRTPLAEVRRGLEQLAHDHPFLLTSRYAVDHAEIRYWEEARDLHDAAALALRLWGEHRSTARLPPWEIVGLEVIDRTTYHQRLAEGYGPPPAVPIGVHPY